MKFPPEDVSGVEGLQVDGLDALLEAGRKLQQLDPARFERVLAICRGYVAIYERPTENDDVFLSRLRQAIGTVKASA